MRSKENDRLADEANQALRKHQFFNQRAGSQQFADEIMCALLHVLGFEDVVANYKAIIKEYPDNNFKILS